LGNSALAPSTTERPAPAWFGGSEYLLIRWAAPIEITIANAMAETVGTTNLKVIIFWVIAELALTYPRDEDATFR
jgi:hypothetical protein